MKWISVIKQTPRKRNNILVLLKSGVSTVANFDGECFNEDGLDVEDITHWIYIPKIPIESERLKTYENKNY